KSETRNCQNCKQEFTIEPEDFAFYEKIKVPPPTWCPGCRSQRRLAFRNEWNLYRRKCDATEKYVISMYAPQKPFPVYSTEAWYGDSWDPMQYGQKFDVNRPFLEQFRELSQHVPRCALANTKSVNSEYTNYAAENKNCYLCVSAMHNENCLYSYRIFNSRDSLDCLDLHKSEFCYECLQLKNSYQCFFCELGESLSDCWFCYDCRGCGNCFGSTGLRNKSYYWLNQQLSKEEYASRFRSLQRQPRWLEVAERQFHEVLARYPRRAARIIKSVNCTGDDIINSKNCKRCFHVDDVEDGGYILFGTKMKDFYDDNFDDESQRVYENMSGQTNYGVFFSAQVWYSRDVFYSDMCQNSSNLFGCVGLRNKHYCILNTQYSEEEYTRLVPRIIAHMNSLPFQDAGGRKYPYGEFFPIEFSPFGYNESVAEDYFPLEERQALERRYPWNDYKAEPPKAEAYSVPDSIEKVLNDVLQKAIISEVSGKPFRILKQELEFHRKFGIPLPRLTPFERHRERLQKLSPIKLYQRTCQKCGAEIVTPYAPDRPEIVYCEKCYNMEVA
ncbi:MAG: hypothetical protein AAB858_01250, partial [Patescibacteria group bacterium]